MNLKLAPGTEVISTGGTHAVVSGAHDPRSGYVLVIGDLGYESSWPISSISYEIFPTDTDKTKLDKEISRLILSVRKQTEYARLDFEDLVARVEILQVLVRLREGMK